jgi:putative phage-type endonuclease
MKTFMFEQYSPEWWAIRKGVPTASSFDKIITAKTMKPSASQDDYICELIADRVTEAVPEEDRPMSKAMAAGLEMEPEARRWYELECDQDVVQVGFCLDDKGRFGCSPDGLVGDDGGLELKCPMAKTQAKYLLAGTLPDEYKGQVHGQMIVTGRKWWDFASYCPGLPPLLIRVTPDAYTDALRAEMEKFWAKYMAALDKLEKAGMKAVRREVAA